MGCNNTKARVGVEPLPEDQEQNATLGGIRNKQHPALQQQGQHQQQQPTTTKIANLANSQTHNNAHRDGHNPVGANSGKVSSVEVLKTKAPSGYKNSSREDSLSHSSMVVREAMQSYSRDEDHHRRPNGAQVPLGITSHEIFGKSSVNDVRELPPGHNLPPITAQGLATGKKKKKKKKKIIVTAKVRKRSQKKGSPRSQEDTLNAEASQNTVSQQYLSAVATDKALSAGGGEGSSSSQSISNSGSSKSIDDKHIRDENRLPNKPVVHRRKKRPIEDLPPAENVDNKTNADSSSEASTADKKVEKVVEKPTFPPPKLCQVGPPTYGVTLSLNHKRFNKGLPGLEERWGEARFLLRKQIKNDEDLDVVHRTSYQSILLLQEIENLSRSLGCLQGTLSRWLMPFDVNTSVADQAVQVGSGNPNDSNGTFSGIDDEKKSELTHKMLSLRSIIRIKVADDNDLAQALNALQDVDAFFRLLTTEAESMGKERFELLETL